MGQPRAWRELGPAGRARTGLESVTAGDRSAGLVVVLELQHSRARYLFKGKYRNNNPIVRIIGPAEKKAQHSMKQIDVISGKTNIC